MHNIELEIRRTQAEIAITSLGVSIGEIVNMYLNGELILQPAYQRSLVWTDEHKDMLIESLLLRLPIPSMFVATDKDGNWEVVDGLQRLSTIIQFVGGNKQQYPKLGSNLKYISSVSGLTFSDLPRSVQLDFKRNRLDFAVLGWLTTEEKKIELFRRVNQCGLIGEDKK
jgi:hypothetical protein